ncbi:thiamine-phosphate kinase [Salinactinospora qingdaonensis]|uniref:thiamine-phosphate kinase n=1 Tax=Salinactinospora qingdaonensis TaxID=702744 RepID=UPI0031ED6F70
MLSTIADIGEFGLIARLIARSPQTDDVLVGPGDDAAIVSAGDGRVVATTDLLVEGRHFRRAWSGPRDVGHKGAAQNLADIAAMAARPTALLVGLAVPADLPTVWADEFAEGLRAECVRAGAAVIGGDVVRSETLTIAITALGDLAGGAPVLRNGARPGDVVAVNGRLGWSAAGFALLEAGSDEHAPCRLAHLRPSPPYRAGVQAAELGATAMLDVSDGLVQDLGHIAADSAVAIDLDGSLLRPAPELVAAVDRLTAIGARPCSARHYLLTGGEDHALAATFPPSVDLPPQWRVIGRVTPGTGVSVDGAAALDGGWDHFS